MTRQKPALVAAALLAVVLATVFVAYLGTGPGTSPLGSPADSGGNPRDERLRTVGSGGNQAQRTELPGGEADEAPVRFEIRVLAADSDRPLFGIRVYAVNYLRLYDILEEEYPLVHNFEPGLGRIWNRVEAETRPLTTGEDGTIAPLLEPGAYAALLLGEDVWHVADFDTDDDRATIRVAANRNVEIQVLDAAGAPCPGFPLALGYAEDWGGMGAVAFADTDREGVARFQGLASLVPEEEREELLVTPALPFGDVLLTVPFPDGDATRYRLTLPPHSSLAIRILDSACNPVPEEFDSKWIAVSSRSGGLQEEFGDLVLEGPKVKVPYIGSGVELFIHNHVFGLQGVRPVELVTRAGMEHPVNLQVHGEVTEILVRVVSEEGPVNTEDLDSVRLVSTYYDPQRAFDLEEAHPANHDGRLRLLLHTTLEGATGLGLKLGYGGLEAEAPLPRLSDVVDLGEIRLEPVEIIEERTEDGRPVLPKPCLVQGSVLLDPPLTLSDLDFRIRTSYLDSVTGEMEEHVDNYLSSWQGSGFEHQLLIDGEVRFDIHADGIAGPLFRSRAFRPRLGEAMRPTDLQDLDLRGRLFSIRVKLKDRLGKPVLDAVAWRVRDGSIEGSDELSTEVGQLSTLSEAPIVDLVVRSRAHAPSVFRGVRDGDALTLEPAPEVAFRAPEVPLSADLGLRWLLTCDRVEDPLVTSALREFTYEDWDVRLDFSSSTIQSARVYEGGSYFLSWEVYLRSEPRDGVWFTNDSEPEPYVVPAGGGTLILRDPEPGALAEAIRTLRGG